MAECRFHGECRLCGGLAPRECDGRGMVTTLSAVGYVYDRCQRFEPMPDTGALLSMAKKLDAKACDLLKTNNLDKGRKRCDMRRGHAIDLMRASSAIRKACGKARA